MKEVKQFVLITIGAVAGFAAFQPSAQASVVPPCETTAANSITFLPINGGGQTYCQSAYGWSDTWFATSQPANYSQHQDVLSGDNALGLRYTTGTTVVGSGNPYNIISPWSDRGALNSTFTGSNWQVVNDISVSGNVGTSKITLGGLDATITTTVGANGVTEGIHFTNTTSATIDELLLSDYYNFHPNGSLLSDIGCATTSYANGTVTTTGGTGGGCSAIVSSGTMFGSAPPTTWDLGLSTDVLAHMAAGTFNQAVGPFLGDGAADLVWNLGSLAANGGSADFAIFKNFQSTPPLPEPASIALLGIGLAGLGFARRRKVD